MPKYKILVTKITEHYEVVEVHGETDLEAKTNAIRLLRGDDSELRWNKDDKVKFRAEVVHG
jgi:hypothetical protein